MTIYTCCVCGNPIGEDIITKRHYSNPSRPMPPPDRLVCQWSCEIERRKQSGQFKRMSKLGNAAMKDRDIYNSAGRVSKIAQSNREKPRRKKGI